MARQIIVDALILVALIGFASAGSAPTNSPASSPSSKSKSAPATAPKGSKSAPAFSPKPYNRPSSSPAASPESAEDGSAAAPSKDADAPAPNNCNVLATSSSIGVVGAVVGLFFV